MNPIFFIDPQGGSGNLGMYDYELLSRLDYPDIYFFGGKTYDYLPLSNVVCKFWFRYGRYNNSILKGLSYVLTMMRILWLVFTKKPTILHIQWIRIPSFDIKYYTILKKLFKINLIYTVHNILPHEIRRNDKQLYKRMYELSDALIVHTETAKKQLIEDFGIPEYRVFVAPHGPLTYKQDPIAVKNKVELLKKNFNLEGKIIFALVGYQSEYKGTDLLIDAWNKSKILKSSNEAVLIIAGNKASDFIKEAKNNIIVIDGFVSNLEFDALMKVCDVIVLPYRRIEQSGVLLTLISHHKPYCATNVGELKVPIVKENLGWIIPDKSSEAIKNTIEMIISNPQEIMKRKDDSEGWKRIEDLYDWKHAAEITQNLYIELSNTSK